MYNYFCIIGKLLGIDEDSKIIIVEDDEITIELDASLIWLIIKDKVRIGDLVSCKGTYDPRSPIPLLIKRMVVINGK